MIEILEKAVEKLGALPVDRQRIAAAILEQIADGDEPFAIPDDELASVLEGLAQADRGELVADADVDAILRRPWR